MSQVTVKASIDAWVDENHPNTNHKNSHQLHLDGSTSNNKNAYIYFARPFHINSTVFSATLKIRLKGSWSGSNTITAQRIYETWKEGQIKWNNRPAAATGDQTTAAANSGSDEDQISIDVTSMMQSAASGAKFFGIKLSLNSSADRKIYAAEFPRASLRPTLEVEWGMRPEAPTGLEPSGGGAVSIAKPVLNWQFGQRGGNTNHGGPADTPTQSQSQVQISTSTSFTSPEYDSSFQSNDQSQWDMAATAWAGISAGATRYWRVRVKDEDGLTSDWSSTASFTRTAKGTVTITNPAASPNNYVDELTPPITWTFSGTQKQAEVIIYRVWPSGRTQEVQGAHMERQTTSDQTWHIPLADMTVDIASDNGHLSRPPLIVVGNTYKVVVRVWDNVDRESTPGDPAFASASREFTYIRDGNPANVPSLIATPVGPKVELEWTRGTMPDFFAILADGHNVSGRIDPTEILDSGTTYKLDWYGAVAGEEVTYEVEAVVSETGKYHHSENNDTADATTRASGKWIVDDDIGEQLAVFIAGQDESSLTVGEQGTTYYPVGSRIPVRITDAVRGLEGTITGMVLDTAARDDLLELKGRHKTYRLIQSTLNIPVKLGEVQVSPQPFDDGYTVSIEVFQVGEFFDLDD